MKNTDFSTLFLERYPDRQTIVNYFRLALGKEDILMSDLTKVNLKKVNDVILDNVSNGAAKTYFAQIKAFINLYKDEGEIPCTQCQEVLHAKKVPSQNVYLTEDEIAELEDFLSILESKENINDNDKCVIDVLHPFLAECYCGARGCDVADFTDDNFQNGYLTYVSKKTKVLSQIPEHRLLRRHLDYKPSREHSSFVMNRIMKRVCKLCGINEKKTLFYRGKMVTRPKYEFVGFHTARRSFATNLHLRNVPIAVIAQMMNHGSDFTMTQRYIVTDINAIGDNAMAFFR